jgi:hypothetical protein
MTVPEIDVNGKVTLGIVGDRVNRLIAQNEALLGKFERHLEQSSKRDERLGILEVQQKEVCKLAQDNRDDLEDMWKKSNILDGVLGFFTVLGSTIAAVIGGRH